MINYERNSQASGIGRIALFLLFVLAGCGWTTAVLGQPSLVEPPPKLPSNWEKYRDSVPVGGGFRVGVMAFFDEVEVNPNQFWVFLPPLNATSDSLLCVEISSKDGRYVAQLPYRLSGPVGRASRQAQPVDLPTSHAEKLRDYTPDELAILAHLSSQCEGPTGHYVVSAWNAETSPDTISVLVNSDVYTSVVGGSKYAVDFEVPCPRLESPAKAYNRRCDIPVSFLTPGITVDVRQRNRLGSKTYKHYSLPLRFR